MNFENSGKSPSRVRPPRKRRVPQLSERRHLLHAEIQSMITQSRTEPGHGLRNALLILLAYNHALRVTELLALRWSDINLHQGLIRITRTNNGRSSIQTLDAIAAGWLFRLWRSAPANSEFVFCSVSGDPLARRTAHFIIAKAARAAQVSISVNPHMLRHARALHLAQAGIDYQDLQVYLGHRNKQNTKLYFTAAVNQKQFVTTP